VPVTVYGLPATDYFFENVGLSFFPEPRTVRPVTSDELQALIEDATADYALGENAAALEKLAQATAAAPDSFEAWHALAEVNFSARHLDAALAAAERAHALQPSDLFINTTLSRIWMERGDKARAEHFGAQAKIASWKDQLKNPPPPGAL
jgi:predicted Zn-dependent protease